MLRFADMMFLCHISPNSIGVLDWSWAEAPLPSATMSNEGSRIAKRRPTAAESFLPTPPPPLPCGGPPAAAAESLLPPSPTPLLPLSPPPSSPAESCGGANFGPRGGQTAASAEERWRTAEFSRPAPAPAPASLAAAFRAGSDPSAPGGAGPAAAAVPATASARPAGAAWYTCPASPAAKGAAP